MLSRRGALARTPIPQRIATLIRDYLGRGPSRP